MFNKTQLKKRMKELYDQGLEQAEIAKVLNSEGFRTPRGQEFNQAYVSKYAIKLRVGRRQRKKKTRSDKKKTTAAKRTKSRNKEKTIEAKMRPRMSDEDKDALIDLFIRMETNTPSSKKLKLINAIMEL